MKNKNNVTYVIDTTISAIEQELVNKKRHVISVDTVRTRAKACLSLYTVSEDSEYCTEVGFNHLISQKLYQKGYRSVRAGYHVNLERCNNINYLDELLKSADISVDEKTRVSEKIRKIKEAVLDGQERFVHNTDDNTLDVFVPMTEEEFMEKLIADAV